MEDEEEQHGPEEHRDVHGHLDQGKRGGRQRGEQQREVDLGHELAVQVEAPRGVEHDPVEEPPADEPGQ